MTFTPGTLDDRFKKQIKRLPGALRRSLFPCRRLPIGHVSPTTARLPDDERPSKRLKVSDGNDYVRDILVSKKHIIVCDSLDFNGLTDGQPPYTAVSPQSLCEGLKAETNRYHTWVAVKAAMEMSAHTETRVQLAMDLSLVELATFQLARFPNLHFTFVDPRIAQDEDAIVEKVQSLSKMFLKKGIALSEVVFNIPATISAMNATKRINTMSSPLNQVNINLTMVQSLMHAAACAEVKPFAITLAVGPVLGWYEALILKRYPSCHPYIHLGMRSLHAIGLYFRQNNIPVKLFASGCRDFEEVGYVLGFSNLILSLKHMKSLRWATSPADMSFEPQLPDASEYAVTSIQYPTHILENMERKAQEPDPTEPAEKPLLPNCLTARTRMMTEHNTRLMLNLMEKQMRTFEAYIRQNVLEREAMSKPGTAAVRNLPAISAKEEAGYRRSLMLRRKAYNGA